MGKQPVGDLRWKDPVDVVSDDGVYEAYNYGKTACQDQFFSNHQGEDCLYLNIWKGEGFDITKEEAEAYMAELTDCELDGKTLKNVVAGGCWNNICADDTCQTRREPY